MAGKIGILTAGNDVPGLNAAIRAIGKTAQNLYKMEIIGFLDGFKGLIENRYIPLKGTEFSGILTTGGTILGTSHDLPVISFENTEMLDAAISTFKTHKLDALVCLGGAEMQVGTLSLSQAGLNVIGIPKSIDNDVFGTDFTIGFDTALSVATEAIDRLHSTAHSHHRIIVVEILGKHTGWLTLGAGMAGGADVILLPEIPYSLNKISNAILDRNKAGKRFSIIAVSEGALTQESAAFFQRNRETNIRLRTGNERQEIESRLDAIENEYADNTNLLSHVLHQKTGLDTRITILGFLLRGGVPSSIDRMRATQFGTNCVEMIDQGHFSIMLTLNNFQIETIPLKDVAGKHKPLPTDHLWLQAARNVGTCFGD
ncbi:MAG: ATP-dependent 6-phosphofructokinase [Anaerolineaceae bacterium]|nr:ATP-dependent 6-phosphofructokinase [Anaerolineaceae bacterium]